MKAGNDGSSMELDWVGESWDQFLHALMFYSLIPPLVIICVMIAFAPWWRRRITPRHARVPKHRRVPHEIASVDELTAQTN